MLIVADADDGDRLDRFIARRVDDLSRSRISGLMRAGHVTGPGGTIVEPSHRVKPGERFEIAVPEPAPATPRGEAIALAILHEDDDVIVIDKPAGLVVHPGAGNPRGTLVNALIAHCGDSLSGIGGVRRPGIVHRLDKDTSGVMVAAKNDFAHRALAAQFADHGREGGLRRGYLALVWGVPPRKSGLIDLAIGRHPGERTRQAVAPKGRGREARTHYEVRQVFRDQAGEPIAALVRCVLETGRTHQVRVHLAAIGTPVMGDRTYGRGFQSKAHRLSTAGRDALANLGRQALHAAELGFAHPRDGRLLTFSAPQPTEMAELTVKLSKS